MEKRNGMVGKEKGDPICHRRFFSISRYRPVNWLVVLGACCLAGCTTIKKASLVGLAGGTGALAGGLASTGVLAPVAGAVVAGAVADVATEIAIGQTGKKAMNECAPDNFWSLLGSFVEMGGWALILIFFVAPMVLGWILPGPLEKKKKGSAS